ncbi:MAG: 7TM diverse intracellular signaling domain-containing protein [Turneriella sp.]
MSPIRIASRFAFFAHLLFAANFPVFAGEDWGTQNVTGNLDYLEDAAGRLTWEDVSKSPKTAWRKIGKEATHFNFSRSVFWLRFDTAAMADFERFRNGYLVFEWKALDSLELFPKDGARIIAGDAFPKSQWSLPEAHFPAFRLNAAKNGQRVFYIRLESTSIKNFPILLKSETNYTHDLKREITIIFIYSTIFLVLILFAVFMYALSRDVNFLIYVGYLLSIVLAFDTTFGNAFDLLWPNATWWQNRAGFTLVGAQIIFSMLFTSRLLDFPRHMPRANFVCKVIAWICAVSLPLSLLDLPVVWFSALYSYIYLLSIPAFFVIGIMLIKKSGPHVRLFIFGWGCIFFFGIFHILYLRSVLPFSYFSVYATILALPVDILFFFMSVWEKQRSTDRERLRLIEDKMAALSRSAKYQKSSLADIDTKQALANLEILLREEKIYLIEDLRLPDLAKALQLNRTQLSELLNSHFGMTFPQFINQYRIEEAKRLLETEREKNILEIAFATGFGSKAAFSTEFKRATGKTASEYRVKFS